MAIHKIKVKDLFARQPIPALKAEHLAQPLPSNAAEGDLLHLTDKFGRGIGTALYGLQPRSVGWLISKQALASADSSFFAHKFANAFEKRLRFLQNAKTDVFRIFNAEGDGIGGLTLDYYDAHILISYYNAGIYAHRDAVRKGVLQNADCKSIVEKKRFGESPDGVVVYAKAPNTPESPDAAESPNTPETPDLLICRENDVRFKIDLIHGGMTGIFADQREVRKLIRNSLAKGKKVLNLFSYTAMFSVFAALGGARSTTNVDLARRSHEWAKENFKHNGLDPSRHSFITEDAFRFLERAAKNGESYDLIVIDPPSFSTSSYGTFSAEKGIRTLTELSLKVASRRAVMIISTNHSQITPEKFRKSLPESLHIVREFSLPADYRVAHDFPESSYLKVAVCTRK